MAPYQQYYHHCWPVIGYLQSFPFWIFIPLSMVVTYHFQITTRKLPIYLEVFISNAFCKGPCFHLLKALLFISISSLHCALLHIVFVAMEANSTWRRRWWGLKGWAHGLGGLRRTWFETIKSYKMKAIVKIVVKNYPSGKTQAMCLFCWHKMKFIFLLHFATCAVTCFGYSHFFAYHFDLSSNVM